MLRNFRQLHWKIFWMKEPERVVLEDHRKTELTRIAFLKAEKGVDGYSLNNFSEKNWYYDRVMEKNNFFAEEYYYSTNAFIMKPYHVL